MATYAVGDIQGCYDPLVRLLDAVNFDPSSDKLYCVGDLVNRGPESLKTLRLLKSLKNQCVTVLGNHDIHLLSMVYGIRSPRSSDTLQQVLDAPDVGEIAEWLRSKPLFVRSKKRKVALVHAGIYPTWSIKQSLKHSREIEAELVDEERCIKLLKRIYSNSPSKWKKGLGKASRQRFIINTFTRMRFVSPKGHLNLTESGFLGKARKNRVPWFELPNDKLEGYRVIFGHWSALGLLNSPKFLCLDTGCVWNRYMTLAKIPRAPSAMPIRQKDLVIANNVK